MTNVRYMKRGGPNRCFECGSTDPFHLCCPKLGRSRREDNDDEKTNDNKPKGRFKGRKKKENLKKVFDKVYGVDGESGDEDKGKKHLRCLLHGAW